MKLNKRERIAYEFLSKFKDGGAVFFHNFPKGVGKITLNGLVKKGVFSRRIPDVGLFHEYTLIKKLMSKTMPAEGVKP